MSCVSVSERDLSSSEGFGNHLKKRFLDVRVTHSQLSFEEPMSGMFAVALRNVKQLHVCVREEREGVSVGANRDQRWSASLDLHPFFWSGFRVGFI